MPLSDYTKYKKLTLDSSKIDSDLSHFPVPIPLGSAVGLTDADVTVPRITGPTSRRASRTR